MTAPTGVHPTITDSISQTNTEVVGLSPAVATSNLYNATSSSINIAIQNLTHAQHALNRILEATTSVGVKMILEVGKSTSS